jgi:catalase
MKQFVISACIAGAIGLAAAPGALAQADVQANDLIELFVKLGGKHPGFRKAHARGVCASGTFSPANSEHFTEAELLANDDLPVTMRFSVGGANPDSDERKPGTRGAGIQIQLPNGSLHHFTGNNFPVFAGKDPATFFGFLSTLLPDESGQYKPEITLAYVQQHPSVQAHAAWQRSAQTAASYANTQYFGLHTFYYKHAAGEQTRFRWQLVPELGVKTLTKEEAEKMPAEFLASTLTKQLADTTVSFRLEAIIGEPGDSDIDPSVQWPDDRQRVTLGTVTLSSSGGDACNGLNFDPNVMSAGFEPSADPVLRMRSPAYAISFGERSSGE